MTTQEKVKIMQAFIEGKQIEIAYKGEDNWFNLDVTEPAWDWSLRTYRIKPEPPKPKLRPYANAEEFLQAMKEHGPMLYRRDVAEYSTVAYCDDSTVSYLYNNGIEPKVWRTAFEELLKLGRFQWQDGTTCGIEEE